MRLRSVLIASVAAAITVPALAAGATAAEAQVATGTRAAATQAAIQAQTATAQAANGIRAAANPANPKLLEECGLDATLVLDSSGSIGGNSNKVRGAANDFLAALKNTNSTMRLISFAKTAQQLAGRAPVNDETVGAGGSLAKGVAAYPAPNGSTNWQQAFKLAHTGDTATPELLIFVTDGDPTSWKADGSGGTGQIKQPNIDNALAQALPEANTVKTQEALGQGFGKTRILMVGVGNGVNNSGSRQRMADVSGPQIVQSAGALVGKSINQVDVAAFTDFAALGAFLRSVVTSLCGNSVTIQKLAQTSSGAQYVPAQGWDMTVSPSVTGGFSWQDPAGAPDNTAATKATAGDQGATSFKWKPKVPANNTSLTISEKVKDNFTATSYSCEIRSADGGVTTKGGSLAPDPTFTIEMKPSDVASCVLKNAFNYQPGIAITKTATDNPVRGNGDGWNETYTYVVRNTGNTPLTVAKPVDNKCSEMSGPTGPGSGGADAKLAPGVEWTYTCTSRISVPTTTDVNEKWSNRVTVVGVPPSGPSASSTDTEEVAVKTPAIEIVKTAKYTDSGNAIPEGSTIAAGSRVTYVYTVTNTGNDTLKNVVVADDLGTDTCAPVTRTLGTGTELTVGATWVYECATTVNPPSSQSSVENTVGVEANWSNPQDRPQNNGKVTDRDPFELKVSRSASLTIIKTTNPSSSNVPFDFDMSGQGVPSGDEQFSLRASGASPGSSRRVELDGPDGSGSTYTVTEAAQAGWALTDASCRDSVTGAPVAANFDSGTRTITPELRPEQDVVCTFVNERLPRLRVTKQTSPTGSSQSFDFTVTDPDPVSSFDLADGETETLSDLAVSDYTIAETVPAGWTLDDVDCGAKSFTRTDDEISLELGYGDDVECMFSNGEIPTASLTILKQGEPADTPTFGFVASGNGLLVPGEVVDPGAPDAFSLAGGESKTYDTHPPLSGAVYTIVEDPPPTPGPNQSGWELRSLECIVNGDTDNPVVGDISSGSVSVSLEPTDTAVCTYVNKQLPRLRIVKNAVDPSTPGDDTEFSFSATGLSPTSFTLQNSANTETFTDVTPGDAFTVTEAAEVNWTLTSLNCSGQGANAVTADIGTGSVSSSGLAYGDDVVCTFVNTKEPPKGYLFILKNTEPANDPQSFDFTATGTGLDPAGDECDPAVAETACFPLAGGDYTGFEVDPGLSGSTYTVTEDVATLDPDWELVDIECTLSSDPQNVITGNPATGEVNLDLLSGDVGVCVFTNRELATLEITKLTDVATQQQFDFTASSTPPGIDPGEFTLGRNETRVYSGLEAGTAVTITEDIPSTPPNRWHLVDISCVGNETAETVDILAGELQVTPGPGEDVSCTYLNIEVPPASVQIVKSADPADGTSFPFTAAGQDSGSVPAGDESFSLAPDGAPAVKDLTVYPRLAGETFTFTEGTLPTDWNLDDITCLDDGSPVGTADLPNQKIDVTIDPGDTVVCTFTNREDATVTVVKSAPDDPTLDFDFENVGLTPNEFSLADGESREFTGLAPGEYQVSEVNIPTDWFLDGVNGQHPDCFGATAEYTIDNGAVLTLQAGEDVVCTFSNFFDYRPSIQLDKVASRTEVVKGESVDYTYTVTNTGNTELDPRPDIDSMVTDDKCSPVTLVSGTTPLAPDESLVFECTGYVVAEDTTNTATATMEVTGGGAEVESTDEEFVNVLTPAMELVKQADQPTVYPGTTVTYTYLLMNTGEVDLQNQTSPDDRNAWVSDDKCSPVSYVSGDEGDENILEVGETWEYTCATALTQTTTNTGTATATPLDPDGGQPVGDPLIETGQQTVDVIKGGIALTKKAAAPGGVDKDSVLLVPADTEVTFTYDVTSGTATVPMKVLAIVDDRCAPVTYQSGDTNSDGLVDPGETWQYQCTQLFAGAQTVTNTATVTAVEPTLGEVSTASDDETVRSFTAGIEVDKTPSKELVRTGSSVTYSYRVSNTGSEALSNVAITDDKCSPVVYRSGDDGDGVLQPAEVWLYECTTTLARSTTNTVVVTGQTPEGATVSSQAVVTVQVFNPANLDALIKVKKTASKKKVKKNGKVVYTYRITNPGKTDLAKVKVKDNKCKPVKYVKGDRDRDGILPAYKNKSSESAKETWIYRCTSKLKKTTVNKATAKGTGWLDGELIGPTVKSTDVAKVRVIGSGGGGGSNGKG